MQPKRENAEKQSVVLVLPRSQIEKGHQTISPNFADSKILDIVRAPYDSRTFCSSSHKSHGHRMALSTGKYRACTSQFRKTPGGHRPDIGRRMDGDRTELAQTLSGLCYHLHSTIR